MNSNTIILYIEYVAIFIIVVTIFNKLIDWSFATKREKIAKKNESIYVIEEAQKVDKTTGVESHPISQYDVYHPSVFSKKRTRQFYTDVTFKNDFFIDEPWLTTLVEVLSLLEFAADAKVIKHDEKCIDIVVGTKAVNEVEIGKVFNAYNLYELTLTVAEDYATYYASKKQNFCEMILSILLLYIDQIDNIRQWTDEGENVLESLVKYLTRELLDDSQTLILKLINEIHFSANELGMIEELQCQISMIQNDLEQSIKVIQSHQKNSTWPKSYHRQKMQKRLYTMDEIRRFQKI